MAIVAYSYRMVKDDWKPKPLGWLLPRGLAVWRNLFHFIRGAE